MSFRKVVDFPKAHLDVSLFNLNDFPQTKLRRQNWNRLCQKELDGNLPRRW